MNILILSQFFSTTKGGGEYVFSMLTRSLAKNGNNVWVITNKIKTESYEEIQNVYYVFVPPVIEYKGGLPPTFSENIRYVFAALRKGLSIINKEKIELIHSNNFSPALTGSILSSLTSTPHLTTVHDVFSLCGKDYWKKWGKQNGVSRLNVLLAPFFEKLIIKLKHKATHTVSNATKEDLIQFGEKKPIYVIPNSIEIKEYKTQEKNSLQFIYIGRLVFYKNIEVIIKAIKIVKETHPNIKLAIVGDGPQKEILEKMVDKLNLEENIIFTGFVSTSRKMELLSSSQALLFPSVCEGFGLVLLEAFSVKIPALVSNVRPLSDIVSDSITGYVIPPYDEVEWAEKIKKIIENRELAFKMGSNGRKLLEEKYSLEQTYTKIIDMYQKVMDKSD